MTALPRRLIGSVLALAGVLAVLAAVVLATALASRANLRLDVTAGRVHELTPATRRALESARGEYELVFAADTSDMDRRTRQELSDLLDELQAGPGRVRVTRLDTATADGVAQYRALLGRLAQREAGRTERLTALIDSALDRLGALAISLDSRLSPALLRVADALAPVPGTTAPEALQNNRAYFEQRAAASRVLARQIRTEIERIGVDRTAARALPVPPLDEYAAAMETRLRATMTELSGMDEQVSVFVGASDMPDEARAAARVASAAVRTLRDDAAVLAERTGRAERLDLRRVARVLEAQQAVLVVGPEDASRHGVTAVELDALVGPNSSGVGIRARAERLLVSAITSLDGPPPPIVVLMHGEPAGTLQANATLWRAARQHLEERGLDVIPWAAAYDPEPPALAEINTAGARPVVYVTLPPDSSAGGEDQDSGPSRTARFARTLNALVADGSNILASLAPSVLPSYGQADPVAQTLAPFGFGARTGAPLLGVRPSPQGDALVTDLDVVGREDALHPVASALAGLRVELPWAIGLERTGAGSSATLLEVDGTDTWSESQWVLLRRTPRERRALLRELPRFNPETDEQRPSWPVVAATQRTNDAGLEQRLVVVGSNGWFLDPVADRLLTVDGRTARENPGNLELLEASVWWLAERDERIAPGVRAGSVPTVRTDDPVLLSRLRWASIVGLPLGVLALGGLRRLLLG